jgi:hypothetical protein
MPSGRPLHTAEAAKLLGELGVPCGASRLRKLRQKVSGIAADPGPTWYRHPRGGAALYFREDLEQYAREWHASLKERQQQPQPARLRIDRDVA